MYRLMIVTNSNSIKQNLESNTFWVQEGFKFPHFRNSKETLVEGLNKHKIDAIAVKMNSEEENSEIFEFLNEYCALVPVFDVSMNVETLKKQLERVRKSLDKINEDYSDDNFTYDQKFNAVRNRWLSKYLRGQLEDYEEFKEKNLIFRANFCLNTPCEIAELTIPQKEEFLTSEWRYGADRLEVALRNFFNSNTFLSNITVAVTDTGICRVLFSKKCYLPKEKLNHISNFEQYVENTLSEIKAYLKLDIKVMNIYAFNSHQECFEFLKINK